jgi:ankyrin repeat protein
VFNQLIALLKANKPLDAFKRTYYAWKDSPPLNRPLLPFERNVNFDVNQRDSANYNLLDYAIIAERMDVVCFLIEEAKVDASYALHMAANPGFRPGSTIPTGIFPYLVDQLDVVTVSKTFNRKKPGNNFTLFQIVTRPYDEDKFSLLVDKVSADVLTTAIIMDTSSFDIPGLHTILGSASEIVIMKLLRKCSPAQLKVVVGEDFHMPYITNNLRNNKKLIEHVAIELIHTIKDILSIADNELIKENPKKFTDVIKRLIIEKGLHIGQEKVYDGILTSAITLLKANQSEKSILCVEILETLKLQIFRNKLKPKRSIFFSSTDSSHKTFTDQGGHYQYEDRCRKRFDLRDIAGKPLFGF